MSVEYMKATKQYMYKLIFQCFGDIGASMDFFLYIKETQMVCHARRWYQNKNDMYELIKDTNDNKKWYLKKYEMFGCPSTGSVERIVVTTQVLRMNNGMMLEENRTVEELPEDSFPIILFE